MSILAEPKTKTKWGLNPRGKLWADDESKFGKKLMEKMGWQKGKGLGKNETGMTKNIVVFSKEDKKGVGWDDKTNNWIAHQDEFNSLLADLNKDYGNDETSEPVAGQIQTSVGEEPVSLEVRSKSFKSRVHYKKFVRGKDVSQYSAEDIGCIFGKKATMEDNNLQGVNETENSTTIGSDGQIKTVTSVLSVMDYFAQKMKNKKLGSKLQTGTNNSSNNDILDDSCQPIFEKAESSVCETMKKTTKNKKRKISRIEMSKEMVQNNDVDEYGRVKRCRFGNNDSEQISCFIDDGNEHEGNYGFKVSQADNDDMLRSKILKDTQINAKNNSSSTEKRAKNKKQLLQKLSTFSEFNESEELQNVNDIYCAEPCLNECNTENVSFVKNTESQGVNSTAVIVKADSNKVGSSSHETEASDKELEVGVKNDDSSFTSYSCTIQESVNSEKGEGDVSKNNKKAKVSKVHSTGNSDGLLLKKYQNSSQKQLKDKHECILGQNTESWGFTIKRTLQLSQYKDILMKFEAHSVFSTTNLTSLKGYGN